MLQKRVTFLGFTVSREGVGTDPDKTEALRNRPIPRTVRQSRSFVGLYNASIIDDSFQTVLTLQPHYTPSLKKGARFE